MGRRAFLLEIPQAVQDQNLTGADLTAGRTATGEAYAVEKSAAASTAHTVLTDNAADLATNANITLTGDTITFTNGSTVIPTGDWTLINRNVVVGTDATAGNLRIPASSVPATKLRLINCNITALNVQGGFASAGFSIGVGDGGAGATRANDAFTAGANSFDVWGCNFAFADVGQLVRFSDFIQSEFFFGQEAPAFFSGSGGGRWINSTISSYNNQRNINSNGLNIYENATINNLVFRHGNTGANQIQQFVIDRPTFNFPPQATYYDFNTTPATANSIFGGGGTILQRQRMPFHIIGGPSWGDTAIGGADTAWGNLSGNSATGGIFQALTVDASPAGAWHYYGFGNRYFSTALQADGDAVAGVRARLTSNVSGGTLTQAGGDIGTRSNPATAADIVNGIGVSITGITGTDGRLAPETYNADGTTEVDGLLNFWDWNAIPDGDDIIEGTPAITVADNVWNATLEQVTSPPGMMLIPIARAVNPTAASVTGDFLLFNFDVTEEVRSFRWDVDEQERTIVYPDIRENLIIPQQGITVGDLSQGTIKTQNLNTTTNLPDISFPMDATVSINDVRDAHRAAWSNYDFDLAANTNFTNTLSIVVILNNALTSDFTATQNTVTVRANGIAPDGTNDHYLFDTNIGSLFLNGGSITDHRLTVGGSITDAGDIVNSIIEAGSGITLNNGSVLDRVTLVNNPQINFQVDKDIIPGTRDAGTGLLQEGWDLIIPEGFTATPAAPLFTPSSTGDMRTVTLTAQQASDYFGLTIAPGTTNDFFNNGAAAGSLDNNILLSVPETPPHRLTFQTEVSSTGGWMALYTRQSTADSWAVVGSGTQTVGAGARGSFEILSNATNAAALYRVLWRPNSATEYTTLVDYDFTVFPTEETIQTVPNNPIPTVLLSSIPLPAEPGASQPTPRPSIASDYVSWSRADVSSSMAGEDAEEVIGMISNTHIVALNGGQTQQIMLSAYTDVDYFETLRTHVNILDTVTPDVILPSSASRTQADGQFVQLDTADGNQQQLTAIENTDLNGDGMIETLQATISGRENAAGDTTTSSGVVISFPAVQIFNPPDGITGSEVRNALSSSFTSVNTHTTTEVDRVVAELGVHDDAISSQTIHGRINLVSANVNQVDRVVDNIDVNLVEVNDNVIVASVKPEAVQTAQNGADPIMRIPPTI